MELIVQVATSLNVFIASALFSLALARALAGGFEPFWRRQLARFGCLIVGTLMIRWSCLSMIQGQIIAGLIFGIAFLVSIVFFGRVDDVCEAHLQPNPDQFKTETQTKENHHEH